MDAAGPSDPHVPHRPAHVPPLQLAAELDSKPFAANQEGQVVSRSPAAGVSTKRPSNLVALILRKGFLRFDQQTVFVHSLPGIPPANGLEQIPF